MTASRVRYEVEAYNTATASTNKIHDDAVAQQYGFRGGLVPGVDVFAYLTRAPVERWGLDWLRHGAISARFARPVYDGQLVTVTATAADDATLDLVLVDPDGHECAAGRATRIAAVDERPSPAAAALPDDRRLASADSLPVGLVLGSLAAEYDPAAAIDYLADVRETQPIYTDGPYAHPGWLLRFANSVLVRNVELGPWIHVGSEVANHDAVRAGQVIDVRAVVVDEYERNGHRFVTLDVAVLADGELVQRVIHTAIHTPRRR